MTSKSEEFSEKDDVQRVLDSLKKAGIDVTTGSIQVSNKPTINSTN